MAHQGYGFCEFLTEEDAEYACKIMNQIKLWGKPIRVNKVRDRSFICGLYAHGFLLQYLEFVVFDSVDTVLTCVPLFTGFIRQKATGRRSEPVHRQPGRECGRETVIRYVQCLWSYGYNC